MRWAPGSVDSQGETIYFEVTDPDGPGNATATVVLGHGAGGSHAAWFQQVPVLAAAGFRVVTWDTRGFGNSSARTGMLTLDGSVADLTAVLDATDTDAAHVVGQSMGGWWAAAFALASPHRTRSLTLANTIGGCWTDALREYFGRTARPAGDDVEVGDHPALSPSLARRDRALAFLYQQLNTFHEPPMAAVVAALTGTRHDPAALRATGRPLLWITGSDDTLFPPHLVAPIAEAAGAELVTIHDAGHSPYFERAAEWNDALVRFLAAR